MDVPTYATGFVVMPFGDGDAEVFWKTLKEAASRFTYLRIHRLNSEAHTGGQDLLSAIQNHVQDCDFVLADFTRDRISGQAKPNVLMETGMALGARKPLYLVGRREDSYENFNKSLPSDLAGYLCTVFPNGTPEVSDLRRLFRKILVDQDIVPDVREDKAGQHRADQFSWALRVVEALRWHCRNLRCLTDGQSWDSRNQRLTGLPGAYYFRLIDRSISMGRPEIRAGAFFERHTFGDSPFYIAVGDEYHPLELSGSWWETSVDEVVAVFLEQFKKVLPGNPQFLSNLSRDVSRWTRHLEVMRQQIVSVGFSINSESKWQEHGFTYTFGTGNGPQFEGEIGVMLDKWKLYGYSPYWISLRKKEGFPEIDLFAFSRKRLSEIGDKREGPLWIPIPEQGDFAENLSKRLERIRKGWLDEINFESETELPGSFDEEEESPSEP